jgi:hypothetical protein
MAPRNAWHGGTSTVFIYAWHYESTTAEHRIQYCRFICRSSVITCKGGPPWVSTKTPVAPDKVQFPILLLNCNFFGINVKNNLTVVTEARKYIKKTLGNC